MSALLTHPDIVEFLGRLRDRSGQYVWYLTPGGQIRGEQDGMTACPLTAAFDLSLTTFAASGLPDPVVYALDIVLAANKNSEASYDPALRAALLTICGLEDAS